MKRFQRSLAYAATVMTVLFWATATGWTLFDAGQRDVDSDALATSLSMGLLER